MPGVTPTPPRDTPRRHYALVVWFLDRGRVDCLGRRLSRVPFEAEFFYFASRQEARAAARQLEGDVKFSVIDASPPRAKDRWDSAASRRGGTDSSR